MNDPHMVTCFREDADRDARRYATVEEILEVVARDGICRVLTYDQHLVGALAAIGYPCRTFLRSGSYRVASPEWMEWAAIVNADGWHASPTAWERGFVPMPIPKTKEEAREFFEVFDYPLP